MMNGGKETDKIAGCSGPGEQSVSSLGPRRSLGGKNPHTPPPAKAKPLSVKVKTAVPLHEEEIRRLGLILCGRYGTSLVLNCQVDPSILGGVWVQIGDTTIDGSIAGKLAALREQLMRERRSVC